MCSATCTRDVELREEPHPERQANDVIAPVLTKSTRWACYPSGLQVNIPPTSSSQHQSHFTILEVLRSDINPSVYTALTDDLFVTSIHQ